MGNGSSREAELQNEVRRAREEQARAENERRWFESERERVAAEQREREMHLIKEQNARLEQERREKASRDKEIEEERRSRAEREKALELQHQREMQRAQEERDRIMREKERALAEKHANELKMYEEEMKKQKEQAERERVMAEKHQKEMLRVQQEKERLQAENHAREMKRAQEEKEEKIRRAEEELRKLEEAHRIQEELRALQEKMRLEEEKKKMEEIARKIEEEARKRVEEETFLREEAERNLQQGIPPVKYPTGEEIRATRQKLGYQEGYLHVAITGCSGCGKSSMINALRGVKNSNSFKNGIARTGTSETTTNIERYVDPNPSRQWLAWYDVPGAGTVNIRDWQYFNDQGLYVFDVIMVVAGDRFTQTDVELLFHCKRFDIATFVVRSKSDQQIRNLMQDDEGDSDDDEGDGEERKKNRFKEASDRYITDTRRNFQSLLQQVGLPQQKVYIVCKETLRSLVVGSKPTNMVDEGELIRDITQVAKARTQNSFN